MSQGLPSPVLLSTLLNLNTITINGEEIEFGHVFFTWCIMAFLLALGIIVRSSIQNHPRGLQNVLEVLIDGLENFSVFTMGPSARRFMPFLAASFIFILCANLAGLVPAFDAPTANINTNAALAITVFIYYNVLGLSIWGFAYIKHFFGPVPAIAFLMLPIELISHISRPITMSLRLFGNIRGEELVLIIFFGIAPLLGTIPLYLLFMLAKVMQAFIFYLLTMLYLKGALEEAH